jgi:hypothetical protein
MKLDFSQQFFSLENIKFHQNPSSGSQIVPCGQRDGRMDRYDEAYSRFHNFANAPKRSGRGTINRVVYKVIFLQAFLWCLMMACSSRRNMSFLWPDVSPLCKPCRHVWKQRRNFNLGARGVNGPLQPLALYPWGKSLGRHCIGGWVGPRSTLDALGKIPFPLLDVEPRSDVWLSP